MPLGNLTSQFFANVYLNELDQFVKHTLKVKYYVRYVDDFVILHHNKATLEFYKEKINEFLKNQLLLRVHPQKCTITPLERNVNFLGFRMFPHHRLLRKSNLHKIKWKLNHFKQLYAKGTIHYDTIYECFQGWIAYASNGNTYKLRRKISKEIEAHFPHEISTAELNRISKYVS